MQISPQQFFLSSYFYFIETLITDNRACGIHWDVDSVFLSFEEKTAQYMILLLNN